MWDIWISKVRVFILLSILPSTLLFSYYYNRIKNIKYIYIYIYIHTYIHIYIYNPTSRDNHNPSLVGEKQSIPVTLLPSLFPKCYLQWTILSKKRTMHDWLIVCTGWFWLPIPPVISPISCVAHCRTNEPIKPLW